MLSKYLNDEATIYIVVFFAEILFFFAQLVKKLGEQGIISSKQA